MKKLSSVSLGLLLGMQLGSSARSETAPSWRAIPIGNGIAAREVVLSRVDPNRLLAYSGILYRTTNGGDQWQIVPARFEGLVGDINLKNLQFDPRSAEIAWGTVDNRVFRTTDFGVTWKKWGRTNPPESISALLLDSANESKAWAGMRDSPGRGVVLTTNAGMTWERTDGGQFSEDVFSLAQDPIHSSVILAGAQTGIARSTNAGGSWQFVLQGGKALDLRWSANGSVVRASYQDPYPPKIISSTDGGSSWSIPQGFSSDAYSFDPEDPAKLCAIVDQYCGGWCGYGYALAVRTSTNDGNNWITGESVGCVDYPHGDLEVQGSHVWMWSASFLGKEFSLSRSDDLGATLTENTTGLHEMPLQALDFDAGGTGYAVMTGGYPVLISTDRGTNWATPALAGFPSSGQLYSFQASRKRADAFQVGYGTGSCDCGTAPSYAIRLHSAGENVTPVEENYWVSFGWDAVSASNHGSDQVMYVWSDTRGPSPFLQWSSDGGLTWDCSNTPFPLSDAVVLPHNDAVVYALARSGDPVRLSPDYGSTWISMSNGLPREPAIRLLMNPTNGLHLLIVFERGLPWESKDGGGHWQPIEMSLSARERAARSERAETTAWELRDARIQNADWDVSGEPARVFLATDRGVWISDWGMYDQGLPSLSFELISYSPSIGLLAAGSRGHSAFALDLPPLGQGDNSLVSSGNQSGTSLTRSSVVESAFEVAPNPFTNSTVARIQLAEPGHVKLTVFDAAGRRVRSLLSENLSAGVHGVSWDARNENGQRLAPGTYFMRLEQLGSMINRRVVVLH